ncbi:MAG: Flp pilus assembly complex ATPase component TadA [Acidobacteriota bacterium]|nr:Flp pilus assembly complex ATPase component TadA [Acidobacteriota bacterium]
MTSSLKDVPLFAGLPEAERSLLEQRLQRCDFLPQSVIVREGSAGDAAFLVLSGRVAVRRKDADLGVEFLLSELGPGQMFGEMALLMQRPRTASVVALEPTTCAKLARGDFERVMRDHPEAALGMAVALAERLERMNQHSLVEFVNLGRLRIDPRVLALVPMSIVTGHQAVPIAFCNNRLTLAMTNPNDIVAFDDVRRILKGVLIEPVIVTEDDFHRFMTTTYPQLTLRPEVPEARPAGRPGAAVPAEGGSAGAAMGELLQSDLVRDLQLVADVPDTGGETKQDLMSASEDAPIIRLANSILGLAIKQGASDIHIEPMEGDVTVRFRIDGELRVIERLPKKVQLGLISRLKILSRLDIVEKRLPQDGRISVMMETKPIDLRVSTMPGKWGEKVVMRILDKSNTRLGLDKLISHAPTLELVRGMIAQPYGIIYVAGPTGSGKTTTLYSALVEINDPGINISTAEDPIEYDLPGVTQIQVNTDIGLTFATVLRGFLRQDPDVLLIGETRDRETAHAAVEAALTGHLVFTTIHTNSAATVFTRLGEMGIEPFLVSSSTIGVIAQRLARRLCQSCKEPYEAEPETCAFFGLPPGTTLYRSRGCNACGGRGLKGRIGIYEVLKMTAELRRMVGQGAPAEEIHAAALAGGLIDLKRYAAILLTEGLTTVEEVTSVVSVES